MKLYRGASSTFGSATWLADVGDTLYYDYQESATTYWYWIEIVSVNGTVGDPIGPATATASPMLGGLRTLLTGEVDNDLLSITIKNQLDQIDVVKADLLTEVADRIAGDATLATAMDLMQVDVDAANAYILGEIGTRGDETSALAILIDDVVLSLDDYVLKAGDTMSGPLVASAGVVGDLTGNADTATELETGRTIDGETFDGTADITVIAPGTHAAASKATPVDTDEIPLVDSAAANVLKKLTWANLKATLKAYFDTLYPSGSGTSSGSNTGDQTSTWSQTDKDASVVVSNGNRVASSTATAAGVRGMLGLNVATDHAYFEVSPSDSNYLIGIANASATLTVFPGGDANGWGYYGQNGQKNNGSGAAYGATFTAGNVIGVEINAGSLTFYKDGVSQGVAYTGLTGVVYPMVGAGTSGGGPRTGTLNTGRTAFVALPSGAVAWG